MRKLLLLTLILSSSVAALSQVRFSDAKLGVSFTYPAGYTLKTGPLGAKDTGLGYLGPIPMEFVAPGGIRIATVEAPPGSYPGTDFINAFFTLSANPFITQEECEQFPGRQDKSPTFVLKTESGIILHGVMQSDGGLGHQFVGEYYHTFSDGQCMEFGYGLVTAGYGAEEGLRQAPYKLIASRLKAILLNVTLSKPKDRRDRAGDH
ncbi:MAG TPA: hypothetical protein VF730_01930 [Terracidiphilus sp.]